MKRQTLILVVIGVVLFVAGGAIAFVSVVNTNKNNKTPTTVSSVDTPVLVATATIQAGTTGAQMQSQGLVVLKSIPVKNYVATDLNSTASLNDVALTTSVAQGQAIALTNLTPSTSAFTLQPGYQGATITVPGVNGLAGYLQPGSRVDVYANVTKLSSVPASQATTIPVPCTELIMTNIEVLDVSVTSPALNAKNSAAGRTVPATETLALAVTPAESQTLGFFTANESLSVVQTQKDTLPPTIGVCNGTGQYTVAP